MRIAYGFTGPGGEVFVHLWRGGMAGAAFGAVAALRNLGLGRLTSGCYCFIFMGVLFLHVLSGPLLAQSTGGLRLRDSCCPLGHPPLARV